MLVEVGSCPVRYYLASSLIDSSYRIDRKGSKIDWTGLLDSKMFSSYRVIVWNYGFRKTGEMMLRSETKTSSVTVQDSVEWEG
jgi:hypothetical protein